jgi:hypothetical protein
MRGAFKSIIDHFPFIIFHLPFANSIWKCNAFSELSEVPLAYVFVFILFMSSSRGCGNCGKRVAFWSVFQALWEQWENRGLFFHGFHQRDSFHSPVAGSDRLSTEQQ